MDQEELKELLSQRSYLEISKVLNFLLEVDTAYMKPCGEQNEKLLLGVHLLNRNVCTIFSSFPYSSFFRIFKGNYCHWLYLLIIDTFFKYSPIKKRCALEGEYRLGADLPHRPTEISAPGRPKMSLETSFHLFALS